MSSDAGRTFEAADDAAGEGYAVAGEPELACWCDLRVIASDAGFGVFNRRYGIPLVDGGTQRLPQIVGLGRALDLILTGRPVDVAEAKQIGLPTRVVVPGSACERAMALADDLAALPQSALRSDWQAVYEGLDAAPDEALGTEATLGPQVLQQTPVATATERFVEEGDGENRWE